MYGPLLLLVGGLFLVAAYYAFRQELPDWKRYWRAHRVTGTVVEVKSGPPDVSHIEYTVEGATYRLIHHASYDTETNSWHTGYRRGEKVPLRVPRGKPKQAVPAYEASAAVGGAPAFALLGTASLGFGLLFTTESLWIAGPVLASLGLWLLILFWLTR